MMNYDFNDRQVFLIFEHYEMLHSIADQFISIYESHNKLFLNGHSDADSCGFACEQEFEEAKLIIEELIAIKNDIPHLNEI